MSYDPVRDQIPALLRRALLANACFSALSALTFCTFYATLADWIGLGPAWILPTIGVGLLVFAGFVAWTALRPQLDRAATWAIIGGDLGWVAGSIFLLAGFPHLLNNNGHQLVFVIALIVGMFALLQYFGLRRTGAA